MSISSEGLINVEMRPMKEMRAAWRACGPRRVEAPSYIGHALHMAAVHLLHNAPDRSYALRQMRARLEAIRIERAVVKRWLRRHSVKTRLEQLDR